MRDGEGCIMKLMVQFDSKKVIETTETKCGAYCNVPINIGRLLATWLAVQAFSQMVGMSTSWSEGSGFAPHSFSFNLRDILQ